MTLRRQWPIWFGKNWRQARAQLIGSIICYGISHSNFILSSYMIQYAQWYINILTKTSNKQKLYNVVQLNKGCKKKYCNCWTHLNCIWLNKQKSGLLMEFLLSTTPSICLEVLSCTFYICFWLSTIHMCALYFSIEQGNTQRGRLFQAPCMSLTWTPPNSSRSSLSSSSTSSSSWTSSSPPTSLSWVSPAHQYQRWKTEEVRGSPPSPRFGHAQVKQALFIIQFYILPYVCHAMPCTYMYVMSYAWILHRPQLVTASLSLVAGLVLRFK